MEYKVKGWLIKPDGTKSEVEFSFRIPDFVWIEHPADEFDRRTAKGEKLNLITGEYGC